MTLKAWQTDNAAITRALRTDSDTLRYAEWWVRRRIYGLADDEARWLYERLVEARRDIMANLTDAYASDLTPRQRQILVTQIEREMDALLTNINNHMLNSAIDAAAQGYAGRAWALDMATNDDVQVRAPLLPSEALRAMVLTPYLGQQWGDNLLLSRDEFVLRIKRALITSLVNGEGVQKAAARIDETLGLKPGKRSEFKAFTYRAVLIARTELLRASNLGALAIYEQNQDILSGWEWAATRDERTCPVCGGLDGKRFAFGDPQLAPPSGSHPGCRCTAVPVLIDTALMDRVAGVRQTYAEWAALHGMAGYDGGLGSQRSADASGINET